MATIIGRCGGGCTGIIDSTATAGDDCGVHSVGASAGDVLTSDGAGGSLWSGGGAGATQFLQVAATSCAGGTTVTRLALSSLNGPHFLDLTTPTQPFFTSSGVYTVDVTSVVLTNSAVNNEYQLFMNVVNVAYTGAVFAQNAYSPIANDSIQASLSMTGVCAVNDFIFVDILNQDAAARDFACQSIRVTKIG